MDLQIRFFLFTAEGAESAEEEMREKSMQVFCSVSIMAENRVSIYN